MIKELINRLLCSMFDSCIVTFGMIVERFVGLTIIATIIDVIGWSLLTDNGPAITWYNVVITGTLMIGVMVIVATIAGFALFRLSELKDSIVLKLDIGYYDSTSSGKLWNKTVATCRKYRGN